MEGTNQAVATPSSQPSVTPTSAAQPSVPQQGISQPQASPAYQVAPQAPAPVYQQQAAPQASAPAANPWQEAFQALSASLNTSNQSQAPVSPSAYQATPTPQQTTQANWASQVAPVSAPSAAPTYSPQVSTQSYSAPVQQEQAAPVRDAYLSQISDESLEVLEHFGAEAPQLLNTYACAVEDALIEQVQRNQSQSIMLEGAAEERAAMNMIMTDPDVLADYVNGFFGPEGPYPTETPEETQVREQAEARQQFEQEILAQEQNQVPANFQRPQQDMPARSRQANVANDFWGGFSQLMDNNPEQAWQYLSQAPQGAMSAKMLVQDI